MKHFSRPQFLVLSITGNLREVRIGIKESLRIQVSVGESGIFSVFVSERHPTEHNVAKRIYNNKTAVNLIILNPSIYYI